MFTHGQFDFLYSDRLGLLRYLLTYSGRSGAIPSGSVSGLRSCDRPDGCYFSWNCDRVTLLRPEALLTTRSSSRQRTCDRTFPYSSHYPESRAASSTRPSAMTRLFFFFCGPLQKGRALLYHPVRDSRVVTRYVVTRWMCIRTCEEPVGSLAFHSFAPHAR